MNSAVGRLAEAIAVDGQLWYVLLRHARTGREFLFSKYVVLFAVGRSKRVIVCWRCDTPGSYLAIDEDQFIVWIPRPLTTCAPACRQGLPC
jgi:hypothetical protein